ncbi:hypothetical protein [Sulfitobacter sp. 1A15299]|uniref:hypothetical protein n=1 Tax=Sulfitobacter sp. 1A15299 TaxID=3368598 RepID=UPI00374653B2
MQHQDAPARAAYDGTCLIVEDSEFDRERLRRVLARAYGGMQVEFAPSIEAARRALSAGDKALILLDTTCLMDWAQISRWNWPATTAMRKRR